MKGVGVLNVPSRAGLSAQTAVMEGGGALDAQGPWYQQAGRAHGEEAQMGSLRGVQKHSIKGRVLLNICHIQRTPTPVLVKENHSRVSYSGGDGEVGR